MEDRHAFSKECVDLFGKDISLNEIARIMGCSKAKVRRVLHQKGLQTGKKIAEKTYTAWRRTGRTRAQPFFGYTYSMGKLVEEPREIQILNLIKRLASKGMTAAEIAKHLDNQRMKPRRAKSWHKNSITKILIRLDQSERPS